MQGRGRVRIRRTHLPYLLLEGALLRAPCGLLLGRWPAVIRIRVGDGPVIERFDVLGLLLDVSVGGILLFELVAVA
jgi:hypothetical protein